MKFKLDRGNNKTRGMSVGLKHYKEMLERRVVEFKKEVVKTIYAWHVSDSDGWEHPWYSGCFRANWMVSVGSITDDERVDSINERPPRSSGSFASADVDEGAFDSAINENAASEFFERECKKSVHSMVSQTFYVVNNTWYGEWLNFGYFDDTTIIGQYPRSHHQSIRGNSSGLHARVHNTPVDFMKTCLDDMKKEDWGKVMKNIRTKFNASQAQGHAK